MRRHECVSIAGSSLMPIATSAIFVCWRTCEVVRFMGASRVFEWQGWSSWLGCCSGSFCLMLWNARDRFIRLHSGKQLADLQQEEMNWQQKFHTLSASYRELSQSYEADKARLEELEAGGGASGSSKAGDISGPGANASAHDIKSSRPGGAAAEYQQLLDENQALRKEKRDMVLKHAAALRQLGGASAAAAAAAGSQASATSHAGAGARTPAAAAVAPSPPVGGASAASVRSAGGPGSATSAALGPKAASQSVRREGARGIPGSALGAAQSTAKPGSILKNSAQSTVKAGGIAKGSILKNKGSDLMQPSPPASMQDPTKMSQSAGTTQKSPRRGDGAGVSGDAKDQPRRSPRGAAHLEASRSPPRLSPRGGAAPTGGASSARAQASTSQLNTSFTAAGMGGLQLGPMLASKVGGPLSPIKSPSSSSRTEAGNQSRGRAAGLAAARPDIPPLSNSNGALRDRTNAARSAAPGPSRVAKRGLEELSQSPRFESVPAGGAPRIAEVQRPQGHHRQVVRWRRCARSWRRGRMEHRLGSRAPKVTVWAGRPVAVHLVCTRRSGRGSARRRPPA